jgi:hypothetical protein
VTVPSPRAPSRAGMARVFGFWRGVVLEIDLSDMPLVAPPDGIEIRWLANAGSAARSTQMLHREGVQ